MFENFKLGSVCSILCDKLVQSRNFEMAITQSLLKPKCMKKSANIEKDLLSSNLPKKIQGIFVKLFKNS